MKHTPGPWEIIGREKSVSFVRGECLLVTVDHREDFGESAPDTYLIAAAPDLLAAAVMTIADLLRYVSEQECPICGEDINGEHEPFCGVAMLQVAIAKAKGGENETP